MDLICPKCKAPVPATEINISTDMAKCNSCQSILKASELINPAAQEQLSRAPYGSNIELYRQSDEKVELYLPAGGFSAGMIPLVIFNVFWLGFISVWTFFASQGSIFFALFSIPFWLVGLGMLAGIINAVSGSQTVLVDPFRMVIRKDRPIRPVEVELPLREIQSIKPKSMPISAFSVLGNFKAISRAQRSFRGQSLEVPAVITGAKTHYFFEDANDAEQEWLCNLLDQTIKTIK